MWDTHVDTTAFNMHKVPIAILNHLQQILFNFTKILKCECDILVLWSIVTHYNESSPTNSVNFMKI